MPNKTIILNKEDINNIFLWYRWLDTLGIDNKATEVCLEISLLDENKKIK